MVLARVTYSLENEQDGLTLPWIGSVFCNGEYSNPLPWCQRLALYQAPWAALWKVDPTTRWWATLVGGCDGYALFRNRLRFSRPGNNSVADFPSVLFWGGGWQLPDAVAARLWPTARAA